MIQNGLYSTTKDSKGKLFCLVIDNQATWSRRIVDQVFSHEHVHHKNGIRNDNSVDNLELWTTSHPYGQRVEDKIKWAKEFLKGYGILKWDDQ